VAPLGRAPPRKESLVHLQPVLLTGVVSMERDLHQAKGTGEKGDRKSIH